MKKLITSLAVLALCSTAAFAQEDAEIMTFSPKTSIINPDEVITATLTPDAFIYAPNADGALVMPVSGYGFSQNPQEPFPVDLNGNTITIPLDKDMWGEPFDGKYYLQLLVVLTEDETPIVNMETEEYVMGMAAYQCYDLDPAEWVKNFPSERSWTEEGLTFSRFYEIGICTFYFTEKVTLPDVPGYIIYTDKNGGTDEPDIENFTYGWDDELGLFAVNVNVKNSEYAAADLHSIEVVLEGVKNGNEQEISVPSIMAVNSTSPRTSPRKIKGVESGLVSANETVNIFNVQGMLVKENVSAKAVNELPAGLYIVNGKKVVVR